MLELLPFFAERPPLFDPTYVLWMFSFCGRTKYINVESGSYAVSCFFIIKCGLAHFISA